MKEGSKGSQTEISCGCAILAFLLCIVQKRQDLLGLEVVHLQTSCLLAGAGCQKREEELQRVTIGENRIVADATLPSQVFLKKGLHQRKKRLGLTHAGLRRHWLQARLRTVRIGPRRAPTDPLSDVDIRWCRRC